jgi:non-ribosomal peptide synthetase component E (peptide arylation enzyme)
VILLSVPIAHNFPLACPGLQRARLLGARTVLAPSPDAETVFALIERERVTWIPAVPATVIAWPSLWRSEKALYVAYAPSPKSFMHRAWCACGSTRR